MRPLNNKLGLEVARMGFAAKQFFNKNSSDKLTPTSKWITKPFSKCSLTSKDSRHKEVHERPKLHEVILERSPSEQ